MNIKTFTIIAIASFTVLSVTACGGKQKASIATVKLLNAPSIIQSASLLAK